MKITEFRYKNFLFDTLSLYKPKNLTVMKARYFYAPAIFSVIPKIFILTEDLKLYSETREHGLVTVDNQQAVQFEKFNPSLHETEEYPILLEITQTEAIETSLNSQINWVNRYIEEKRIRYIRSKQA